MTMFHRHLGWPIHPDHPDAVDKMEVDMPLRPSTFAQLPAMRPAPHDRLVHPAERERREAARRR
jgi:hypothetical protein